MTIRSYSSLLVMETLFDSIPDSNPDLNTFADSVFTPHVKVTENDCGTALGEILTVNYELEGRIELSTSQVISKDRIEQLLSQGVYQVPTRSLSTCIAKDGVCRSCYYSSRQHDAVPVLGHSVQVFPEYQVAADVYSVLSGDTHFVLSQDTDMYDRLYVYYEGILLPDTLYTVTNTSLDISSSLPRDGQLTTKFTTITRVPFLAWLADTYSGAMLGLKALPYPKLPVRKRLLAGLIPLSMLELLTEQAKELKAVPPESVDYLDKIKDPLEKALFVIALFSVYLNVL